ncbi:hypothetical protein AB8B23_04950 [Leptotrichia sp. HSP-342]|uniref:Uncharacterized protein n=1 Tax=Leptotrichia mesophila TaxID=3239303 RepID=A0AB39VE08_9FUSO
MIILTVAIIGCSARDIALWKESDRRAAERGVRCFKRANGDYYCKDRYGNIVY